MDKSSQNNILQIISFIGATIIVSAVGLLAFCYCVIHAQDSAIHHIVPQKTIITMLVTLTGLLLIITFLMSRAYGNKHWYLLPVLLTLFAVFIGQTILPCSVCGY